MGSGGESSGRDRAREEGSCSSSRRCRLCLEWSRASRGGKGVGGCRVCKERKGSKGIVWADEVGKRLIDVKWLVDDGHGAGVPSSREAKRILGRRDINGVHKPGRWRDPAFKDLDAEPPAEKLCTIYSSYPSAASYKEVVLGNAGGTHPPSLLPPTSLPKKSSQASRCGRLPRLARTGRRRCFKCLASDHFAAACRDPVRCLRCLGYGHCAARCEKALLAGPHRMNGANGANRRQGRVMSSKAFVPLTEEYVRRSQLRRNALLADIVQQPAGFGASPQQDIANALARHFGGYAHDFFVARYYEHDFVIVLPRWVSAEVLIRRQIITLDSLWLRCFAWGPYRNARPHRPRLSVWIQLRHLPFECWTTARVAAMVSGFGRFISADDASKEMTDLRGYRCRIAVDNIAEIPRTLSIVLGEEAFSI